MDPKNNNNKNSKGGRNLRGVLVLLAWALVLTIGFNYFAAYTGNAAHNSTSFEVDFSALADLVREDKIARVEFEDGKIYAVPIETAAVSMRCWMSIMWLILRPCRSR